MPFFKHFPSKSFFSCLESLGFKPAVRQLGYSLIEVARQMGMTQPGVGYALLIGERIKEEKDYQLTG